MMHHRSHASVHGGGGGGGAGPHTGPPPGAAPMHRHQMHQPIPHQQLPPHQMHHDSRHPMGHAQPSNMAGMGQSMGGMGTPMGVPPPHHGPSRPPHPIRPMAHHTPAQHHSMPPVKGVRRGFPVGGSYGPPAPLQPPPAYQQPPPPPPPVAHHTPHTPHPLPAVAAEDGEGNAEGGGGYGAAAGASAADGAEEGGSGEAARPPLPAVLSPHSLANSKEKTPMCLVNELARFNKIKHQYRLTSETGPAHKKIFTVTLRLGETEEYTAEGSSIKRAQHAAASAALTQTRHAFPPPKLHAHHAPAHAASRHTGAVMPTVELNALAMKLCEPAVYTSVGPAPPVPPPGLRYPRFRPLYPPYAPRFHPPHPHYPHPQPPFNQMGVTRGGAAGGGMGGGGAAPVYRVRVAVGERSWAGEGPTPQAARHDAAARALHDLRDKLPAAGGASSAVSSTAAAATSAADAQATPDAVAGGAEGAGEASALDVKSPVSLVHELALKRNLSVLFSVKSERGPPHMRVFVTTCTVGKLETEGEGNGKKMSKKRAAERMLEEMRRLWPEALLRTGVTRLEQQQRLQRKQLLPKKKPRNLIKENGSPAAEVAAESADNPISRLAMARHAERARSPQYSVVEERGAPRKREFVVRCDAPPHSAAGVGPNKKIAKRRAAHNLLVAMGLGSGAGSQLEGAAKNNIVVSEKTETKLRNEADGACGSAVGGDVRQPVPGVLLMPDYSHRSAGQPSPPSNGISESAATGCAGGAGGSESGAEVGGAGSKDQLLYLSQLLGFNVQFSDFPKRNHGEYLSLVALSTVPPIMCHGGGASTQQSHEQCSRAALRALAHMGLDTPATPDAAAAAATASATAASVVAAVAPAQHASSPGAVFDGAGVTRQQRNTESGRHHKAQCLPGVSAQPGILSNGLND